MTRSYAGSLKHSCCSSGEVTLLARPMSIHHSSKLRHTLSAQHSTLHMAARIEKSYRVISYKDKLLWHGLASANKEEYSEESFPRLRRYTDNILSTVTRRTSLRALWAHSSTQVEFPKSCSRDSPSQCPPPSTSPSPLDPLRKYILETSQRLAQQQPHVRQIPKRINSQLFGSWA